MEDLKLALMVMTGRKRALYKHELMRWGLPLTHTSFQDVVKRAEEKIYETLYAMQGEIDALKRKAFEDTRDKEGDTEACSEGSVRKQANAF